MTTSENRFGVLYSKRFIDPRERGSVSEVMADDGAVIFPNGKVYEVVNLEDMKNHSYPKDSKDIIVAKDAEGRRILLVPNRFDPMYFVAHNNIAYAIGGFLGLAAIVGAGTLIGRKAIKRNPANTNKIANITKFWMITVAGGFAGFWGSIPYVDTAKRIDCLKRKLDKSNQIDTDVIKDLFGHDTSDICSIKSLNDTYNDLFGHDTRVSGD